MKSKYILLTVGILLITSCEKLGDPDAVIPEPLESNWPDVEVELKLKENTDAVINGKTIVPFESVGGDADFTSGAYTPSTDSGYVHFNDFGKLFRTVTPLSFCFDVYPTRNGEVTDRAGVFILSTKKGETGSNGPELGEGVHLFYENYSDESKSFVMKGNFGGGKEWGQWVDLEDYARITENQWSSVAFVVDNTEIPNICIVYINGEKKGEGEIADGVVWDGVVDVSIGSGNPNFHEWGHKSIGDGMIRNVYMTNKILTAEEVKAKDNSL